MARPLHMLPVAPGNPAPGFRERPIMNKTVTVNVGNIALSPAGQSKAGKPVYKATIDTPAGRMYVSLYAEPPETAPATAAPVAPVKRKGKGKDLSEPAAPAPSKAAPADDVRATLAALTAQLQALAAKVG